MTSPLIYLKHVREEFAHIVWPTSRVALAHTLIVIIIGVLIAVLVGALDYVFSLVVSRVVGG